MIRFSPKCPDKKSGSKRRGVVKTKVLSAILNIKRKVFKPTAGDPKTFSGSELLRRQMMLYLLSLSGAAILCFMSIILFLEKEYFYGALDIGFIIFLTALYALIRTGKHIHFYCILSVLTLQLFLLYLFHSGAGDGMAFIWYYLVPLVALFLLGTKHGTILSISLIGFSILANVFSIMFQVFVQIAPEKMIRIVISYFGVLYFALAFESTRKSTQKKLERSAEELNELAIRDTLTGLYSRRYMNEIIFRIMQQLKRTGFAVAVLMVDLDYFKGYNDTYGHQAGDELLKAFSDSLVSCVRRKTDFIFRYGGEEFVLIFAPTSKQTVERMAKSIIRAANELPYIHEQSPHGRITVSLGGVYCDTTEDTDFEKLINESDDLLYQAKEAGRNRYIIKSL